MPGPFTADVVKSLDYLRQAIVEVTENDPDLGDTLTAITDDLIVNLENQMLLVFANVGLKEKEREELLVNQRGDVGVLEYYQEARKIVENKIPISSPKRKEAAPERKLNAVETEAQKQLTTSIFVTLEAVAHELQAERCMLYLAHKGTGSLRVICSVPDVGPTQRGCFVAMHQGVVGAVYSTGVSIRMDAIDEETGKLHVYPVDHQLEIQTVNTLVFPVADHGGNVFAVIEASNKSNRAPWGINDEALLYQASYLLAYMMSGVDCVDFHTAPCLNPSALHLVKAYRPAPFYDILSSSCPDAMDTRRQQLIVRMNELSQFPVAVKGKQQHAIDNAAEVTTLLNIKEMKSYIKSIDVSHRHGLTELLTAKEREQTLQEEINLKSNRVKMLEDNVSFLQDQLKEARHMINKQSFSPMADNNFNDFQQQGRKGAVTDNKKRAELGDALNFTRNSSQQAPVEGSLVLREAMSTVEKLRRMALEDSTASQRSMLLKPSRKILKQGNA